MIDIEKRKNIYEDKYQLALYEIYENGDREKLLKSITEINAERRRQVKGLYYRYTGIKASRFEWDNPLDADGVPIYARTINSASKVNHKNHTPFDQKITVNKSSYIVGNQINVQENLRELLNATDFDTIMYELVQASTRGGNAFILMTIEDKVVELKKINEWECVSVYHPITGELVFSVRYYPEIHTDRGNIALASEKMIYELYESDTVTRYESQGGQSFTVIGDKAAIHGFSGIPLIEFPNNTERMGDVELTLSLQDAFDIADSDLSSEISQLRLAYLALIDQGLEVDDDLIDKIVQTGIIPLTEHGDAKFIDKNLNAAAVENLKKDLERRIYAFSNSYNPDELGTDGQMTAYQIRQKLFSLDNSSNETIAQYKKSLRYLFGVLLNTAYTEEINFMKNIPRNTLEDVKMSVEAGFRFSQDTIAQFIPLPINQEENKKQLEEEGPSIEELEVLLRDDRQPKDENNE